MAQSRNLENYCSYVTARASRPDHVHGVFRIARAETARREQTLPVTFLRIFVRIRPSRYLGNFVPEAWTLFQRRNRIAVFCIQESVNTKLCYKRYSAVWQTQRCTVLFGHFY